MVDRTSANGQQQDEVMALREIEVSVRIYTEDGQWVAYCPELDVSSCGDTVEEAWDNIYDAVRLYLNTIEAEGERDRVFRERGVRFQGDPQPAGGLEPDAFQRALRLPLGAAR